MLRFLGFHAITGVLAGWALLAILLLYDVAGLGGLIWNSNVPAMALAMLAAVFAITFGSAGVATGVLLFTSDGDDGDG
ncbi:MAG: hypothetical protein AAF909_15770 [Pseudomonadota bacterium]